MRSLLHLGPIYTSNDDEPRVEAVAVRVDRIVRVLGVIASMQPTHCTSDLPWVPDRIGAARTAEGAYLWQTLQQTGAVVASGSDFPVEHAEPMLGFYAAITRQVPDGQPPGGWAPEQRMTRHQHCAVSPAMRRLPRTPMPIRASSPRAGWPTSSCCPGIS